MKEQIRKEVSKIKNDVMKVRHMLHQIPEPAFEEKATSALIAEQLQKLGLYVKTGIAKTGIVADIHGALPGNTVALRADMDALPIQETTTRLYKSRNNGFSHSCGHDGHIACLLGTARVLCALQRELSGTIRFIFQPGEEHGMGAKAMIEEGVLENPRPVSIFALHAWPGIPVGCVATRSKALTSACNTFSITVTGREGHGARPLDAKNSILGAAKVVQRLCSLSHPRGTSDFNFVVSVGSIHGGSFNNVIPATTTIKGTVRYHDDGYYQQIQDMLKKTVEKVCAEEGFTANVDINSFCQTVKNHPALYNLFREVSDELLGKGKRMVIDQQSMGSEDFSCYLQHIPGLMFRLGMGEESALLHTGDFDFADGALPSGITLLAGLSLRVSNKTFNIEYGIP